jgi:hypothetical protein
MVVMGIYANALAQAGRTADAIEAAKRAKNYHPEIAEKMGLAK